MFSLRPVESKASSVVFQPVLSSVCTHNWTANKTSNTLPHTSYAICMYWESIDCKRRYIEVNVMIFITSSPNPSRSYTC